MTNNSTEEAPRRVAIIPARGGSKRIKRKNVRTFWGHPLIAYTIAAANNSAVFERVIVSTDDDEIAQIAVWYGAEVMLRSKELANDTATVSDVAIDLLKQLHQQRYEPHSLCLLMPVCPLRTNQDIREHLNSFESRKRQFQISVVSYRGLYPHWAHIVDSEGIGRPVFTSDLTRPSQSFVTTYCPTGAIWWADGKALANQRTFYGSPLHLEVIDDNRGLDIDTMEDWTLADLLVRGLTDRDKRFPLEPISQDAYLFE